MSLRASGKFKLPPLPPVALRPNEGQGLLISLRFLHHTQRRHTVGSTLDEWSTRRRDLPDNTQHSQQTDIHAPPAGFAPTISAGERPQTDTLERAAPGPAGHSLTLR